MKHQNAWLFNLMLIGTAFLWGVSFLWVKDALNAGLDSSFFLFLRYLLASLIWLPFCGKEVKKLTFRQVLMGLTVGFFLYAAMLVQTIALGMTTPSNSAFITTSYVVLTPFVVWALLRQKPKKKIYACAALCFLGLYVLTRVPGESFSLSFGDGLTLVSALLFALQMTFLYRFSSQLPSKVLTFLPQATTCVLSFITALVTEKVTFQGVDVKAALIPTLLVVFLATLAAGYFQTVGQKNVEPSRCAIIFSLESVFACIASVVMGYEPLTTNLVAGGLIIVTSIIISELPSKADRRQARLVKQMRQEEK